MKGSALFGLLGVAMLLGTTAIPEEPTLFDAPFSDDLSTEQSDLLDRMARDMSRIRRDPEPKLAFEALFRIHSRLFPEVETDYLYFFLLATDLLHAQGALTDEDARDAAEFFKEWWGVRALGTCIKKGPLASWVRDEILEAYPEGEDLVRLWARFDYPQT